MKSVEKINKLYSFYARESSYLRFLESLLSKNEDIFENDFCDRLQQIISKDAISTKKIYSPLTEVVKKYFLESRELRQTIKNLASEIHQNEDDLIEAIEDHFDILIVQTPMDQNELKNVALKVENLKNKEKKLKEDLVEIYSKQSQMDNEYIKFCEQNHKMFQISNKDEESKTVTCPVCHLLDIPIKHPITNDELCVGCKESFTKRKICSKCRCDEKKDEFCRMRRQLYSKYFFQKQKLPPFEINCSDYKNKDKIDAISF